MKHITATSSSLPHVKFLSYAVCFCYIFLIKQYSESIYSSCIQAITMHMVSYAGVANLQILVAKDIIPDPKVVAHCLEDALLEMKFAAESARKS